MTIPRMATIATLMLALGCAGQGPMAPDAPLLSLGQSGFQVVTLHIGADPASESTSRVWGPLQVQIGDRLPPNPCHGVAANPGPPNVPVLSFCGVLHNPAGEMLTGGEFQIGLPAGPGDGVPTVPFRLTAPPNPCTRLFIAGVLAVPGVAKNPGPPTISATFTTLGGQLLSSWVNPGPPTVEKNPGPPGVQVNPGPPGACTATVLSAADG